MRRAIALVSVLILTLQTIGCGTIIYPERRGQKAGRIDPGVAVLDGLGLLLFFVPGVVAFGVDFATGAIYLPGGGGRRSAIGDDSVTTVQLKPGTLSTGRIESVVAAATGVSVSLADPRMRREPVANADELFAAMRGVMPAT